jgi:hypothetical protein
MRLLLALWILTAISAAAGPLEIAVAFSQAGANQLALARIERDQPSNPAVADWREWEQLRLSLLEKLDRSRELLNRVADLPPDEPKTFLSPVYFMAVHAALKLGQGALAGDYLTRLLWQFDLNSGDYKDARALVIESYFSERQHDAAYQAMLRYQQDFHAFEKAQLHRFVEALVENGMEKEAVNWLAQLDENSPVKLLLRLKAKLVTPQDALPLIRAALKKSPVVEQWGLLLEAGKLQGNLLLQLEARENILSLVQKDPEIEEQSRKLWQAYLDCAQQLGNENQLLTGDDQSWLELAERTAASSPVSARALWAALAPMTAAQEARAAALNRFGTSLLQQGLDLTAIRLFAEDAHFPNQAPDLRYVLGKAAVKNHAYTAALRFWDGLAVPSEVSAEEWQLQIAAVYLRTGRPESAAAGLHRILEGKTEWVRGQVRAAAEIAQGLVEMQKSNLAQPLLEKLLPLAEMPQKREILMQLGNIAENSGSYRMAADFYLRAATLSDSNSQDELALSARLRCAQSLAKDGLKEDARAEYQWLLKASKDLTRQEAIKRELKQL